jgi:hypothetical protein
MGIFFSTATLPSPSNAEIERSQTEGHRKKFASRLLWVAVPSVVTTRFAVRVLGA